MYTLLPYRTRRVLGVALDKTSKGRSVRKPHLHSNFFHAEVAAYGEEAKRSTQELLDAETSKGHSSKITNYMFYGVPFNPQCASNVG